MRSLISFSFGSIVYYSDFPYSQKDKDENVFIKDHNLTSFEWHGNYSKKKELVLTYKTQLVSLFRLKDFLRFSDPPYSPKILFTQKNGKIKG